MGDLSLLSLFHKASWGKGLEGQELSDLLQGMAWLAEKPLHRRLPYLDFLKSFLDRDGAERIPEKGKPNHSREEGNALTARLRTGAMRLLGYARGTAAWKMLVRGLDDEEEEVRIAAVQSLWKSAAYDPGRWVHAWYHPRQEVRAEARQLGPPGDPPPAIVAQVQATLTSPGSTMNPRPGRPRRWVNLSETAVGDLVELFLQGVADEGLIAALVERATPDDLMPLLMAGSYSGPVSVLERYLERYPDLEEHFRGRFSAELFARHGHRDQHFPLLLQAGPEWRSELLRGFALIGPDCLERTARAIVISGSAYHEQVLAEALGQRKEVPPGLGPWLLQSENKGLRYQAGRALKDSRPGNQPLLDRLAEAFAWGVETAWFHTHQTFEIRMILGEQGLGYTRLRENKLFVSPRPLVLGEPRGEEVVRGLILHELGHHLYHKGPEADRIHDQAEREGLGRLLNLVSDEHLERNLRRLNGDYGRLLKLLNAYAFQHGNREVEVASLLARLKDRAGEVLPKLRLAVARKPGHVAVASGKVLREMAEGGVSFVRFLRALRMGLGNREGDPRVAAALALFRGDFRKSDMKGLLEIAHRLREIFGEETDLLDSVGAEAGLELDTGTWDQAGGGFTEEQLRNAVERLLEQRAERENGAGIDGGGGGIDLGPDEAFDRLRVVSKLQHDPAAHAREVRKIASAVKTLRRFFEDLGAAWQPQSRRLQGYRFDRGRTLDLVVRGDPRVLTARQRRYRTDLFVGVAIDCSGSMAGPRIEKGRSFGTLLAEALKDLPGADLRLFGFDDKVLYDAGDARRCAVHALRATWGNNDAGALYHLWKLARRSRRRARLLIMISDGLPSACTVTALRGLVRELSRKGCCCAQVAVAPLSEICFPHHILLEEQDLGTSVRKFGTVVARLVRRILG